MKLNKPAPAVLALPKNLKVENPIGQVYVNYAAIKPLIEPKGAHDRGHNRQQHLHEGRVRANTNEVIVGSLAGKAARDLPGADALETVRGAPLDVREIRVSRKASCNLLGIRTIGQLAETDPKVLAGWFGKVGYSLSSFARGTDHSPVCNQNYHAAVKSVGNSGTTPRDLVNDQDVWLMLVVMSESVAMRMRELGMKCTVVELYVRDCDLSGFTRQCKIDTPTNGGLEIAHIAFDLFKRHYRWGKPLRGVGVRGGSLVPQDCPVQLDLFISQEQREKQHRVDVAVDTIRRRFGFYAIQRGLMYTDRKLAALNAKEDNVVHPHGYMERGNRTGAYAG